MQINHYCSGYHIYRHLKNDDSKSLQYSLKSHYCSTHVSMPLIFQTNDHCCDRRDSLYWAEGESWNFPLPKMYQHAVVTHFGLIVRKKTSLLSKHIFNLSFLNTNFFLAKTCISPLQSSRFHCGSLPRNCVIQLFTNFILCNDDFQ